MAGKILWCEKGVNIMGKKSNIFTEEIEMPEIVLQKVEDAFIKIRK